MTYYLLLAAAIVTECGGTFCMKLSEGFTKLWPSIGCIVLYLVCFTVFAKALEGIKLSVAYATWGAVGIVLATLLSVIIFKESLHPMAIVGIIVCIVGVVLVNYFSYA